ncbi:MAG: nuclear transport factor 2 family protein [Saprospiraceae bacterium]
MKLVLILLAGSSLLCSCIGSKGRVGLTADVVASETQRFEQTVAGDTAALRTFLHPSLLYIHSNGLEETLQGHLDNVGGGKIDYQSFTPLQSTKARIEGKLALVDGLVAVAGLYDGYPFTVNLRYTATYRKTQKRWQLLRWQSTKIEED